jgi:outer membrane protein
MKKSVIILSLFLFSTLGLQGQSIKIATVDIDRIYNEYYKKQEADKKLETSLENAQKEINRLRKEGEVLVETLNQTENQDDPTLSPEKVEEATNEINLKKEELRQKQIEFRQFVREAQETLQAEEIEYRRVLLAEIQAKITEISKAKKASLVLDTSGKNSNGVSTIYYSSPGWDMTDEVISVLNASKGK